eukprot:3612919-Pyramimonas_sp.AAC.3
MSALDKYGRGAWNLAQRVLIARGIRGCNISKERLQCSGERISSGSMIDVSGATRHLPGFTTPPSTSWESLAPMVTALSATRESSRSEAMGDNAYAARAAGALVGGFLMLNSVKQAEMEEAAKSECTDCSENSGDSIPAGFEEANVVSNDSTAQWRIYTDMGRDFFVQPPVHLSLHVWGHLAGSTPGSGEILDKSAQGTTPLTNARQRLSTQSEESLNA